MLRVSHIVNSVFTSRTYVLAKEGEDGCWIVDCGDVEPLLARLAALGGDGFPVRGVLLTHAHYDHIYGLPRLAELFPEAPIYTNAAGRQALADPRANMSKYHDDPIAFASDRVVVCDEGARIALFPGVDARVYATPGHHPSCLAYEAGGYLFTGDAYIPGVPVVTSLPGADKALAAASRERILSLLAGPSAAAAGSGPSGTPALIIAPGHEVPGLPEGIVHPGSSRV